MKYFALRAGCTAVWVAAYLGFLPVVAVGQTVYVDEHVLYDPNDPWDAIQAIINNVPADKVVFRNTGSPWVMRKQVSIIGKDDMEFFFEPGVEVQALRGAFTQPAGSLFAVHDSSNIAFSGYGASFKMWKEDYQDPNLYTPSEFRHALAIRGGANVTVEGLTIRDSGGDGILVDSGTALVPSSNVVIQDVVLDNNYRQGLSVASVDGLLVNRSVFSNTGGTSPQAGIDFEPDVPAQQLTNVVVQNSTILNNDGAGIQIFLDALRGTSLPVDIVVDGVKIIGGRRGIWVTDFGFGDIQGRTGSVVFKNGEIIGTDGPGIQIEERSSGELVDVSFTDYRLVDVAANPSAGDQLLGLNNPVTIHSDQTAPTSPIGGVTFNGVSIEDNKPRSYFLVTPDAQTRGIADVDGQFTIINPFPSGLSPTLGPSVTNVQIQTTTSTATTVLRFDFERPGDTPSTGYTHVDENTLYDPLEGYGIQNASASRASGSRSSTLTSDSRLLDFVSLGDGVSEFAVDLPNGVYMVTLAAGDAAFDSTERFEIEGVVYGRDGEMLPDSESPLFLLESDGTIFSTTPIPASREAGGGQVSIDADGSVPEFLYLDRALIEVLDGQLNISSTGTTNGFHLNFLEIIPLGLAVVPEPGSVSLALLGSGAVGLLGLQRGHRRRQSWFCPACAERFAGTE